jgi:hypothetical protein
MTAREMRPHQVEAQPESLTKATASRVPDGADLCRDQLSRMESALDQVSLSLDDRQAAFEAGRWLGQNERIDIEIEDQIQIRLHARTLEALGMAKRSARHGEAFSQLVRESGERE